MVRVRVDSHPVRHARTLGPRADTSATATAAFWTPQLHDVVLLALRGWLSPRCVEETPPHSLLGHLGARLRGRLCLVRRCMATKDKACGASSRRSAKRSWIAGMSHTIHWPPERESLCCCLCKLTILNSELGELLGDVVQGRREFWNIFLWTRWTGLAMASERNWRGGGEGGREGGARGVKHAPCDDHHREEENHSTHRPPRPS